MGQQQLLLIVLGVIIVGIAIAVGISMFKSNAQSSNRDQVINDLNNLAAKAQQYYRKPTAMGGGGQDFGGFKLASIDSANANGRYGVTDQVPPVPDTTFGGTIKGPAQTIYIFGVGTETGNDRTNKVQAYVKVTPDSVIATTQN